jgi:uncharacterized protein (UPF0276 family)
MAAEALAVAADVEAAVAAVAKIMEELPKLGAGIGFREQFRADIFLNRESIDFLEITTDHYLDATPRKLEELELLRQHFPLIPHSLELSLGSAEGVDEDYLDKLAELIDRIQPPWFSDHICFTKSNGIKIGHLAPVPYTKESLSVFAQNIEQVKKRISTPLILENITYNLQFPSSEMSESEFISRLLEQTNCGMLLDVTNLYINSQNLGYDWRKYLDRLPLERVVQLHFVGSQKHGKRFIDAHANKTEDEIWNVFDEVCVRCDIKGAVLERDEKFPPFVEIVREVEMARNYMNKEELAISGFRGM